MSENSLSTPVFGSPGKAPGKNSSNPGGIKTQPPAPAFKPPKVPAAPRVPTPGPRKPTPGQPYRPRQPVTAPKPTAQAPVEAPRPTSASAGSQLLRKVPATPTPVEAPRPGPAAPATTDQGWRIVDGRVRHFNDAAEAQEHFTAQGQPDFGKPTTGRPTVTGNADNPFGFGAALPQAEQNAFWAKREQEDAARRQQSYATTQTIRRNQEAGVDVPMSAPAQPGREVYAGPGLTQNTHTGKVTKAPSVTPTERYQQQLAQRERARKSREAIDRMHRENRTTILGNFGRGLSRGADNIGQSLRGAGHALAGDALQRGSRTLAAVDRAVGGLTGVDAVAAPQLDAAADSFGEHVTPGWRDAFRAFSPSRSWRDAPYEISQLNQRNADALRAGSSPLAADAVLTADGAAPLAADLATSLVPGPGSLSAASKLPKATRTALRGLEWAKDLGPGLLTPSPDAPEGPDSGFLTGYEGHQLAPYMFAAEQAAPRMAEDVLQLGSSAYNTAKQYAPVSPEQLSFLAQEYAPTLPTLPAIPSLRYTKGF